jgi:rhomboid family GlyGly-CTERM serine protease
MPMHSPVPVRPGREHALLTPERARYAAVGAILALATAAQFLGLVPALRYERDGLADGELWRALTAHLVHLGPRHLFLNGVGLVLVAALVGPYLRLAAWLLAFVVSALTISAGLWLGSPGLAWYVGLSGVLHGLFIAGALAGLALPAERRFALAVLVLVLGKLIWEQGWGALPGTAEAAGGRVVVDSHLYGGLGGLIAGAMRAGWTRLRPPAREARGR